MKTSPRPATSIKTIAEQAGVSVATVSRVLNNSGPVSTALREKVLEAVDRSGYQPNLLARGLRTKQTGVVGLVLPTISNEHFSGITRAFQDHLSERGVTVLVSNSDGHIQNEIDAIRTLIARRVDGIALVSSFATNSPTLDALIERKVPVVAIDRAITAPIDHFLVDVYQGTLDAVLHLAEHGRSRIAFAAGPEHLWTAREKLRGYTDGILRMGGTVDPSLILEGDYTQESGTRQAEKLLELSPRPDGLIFANNLMALGGFQTLLRSDVRVPDDLSIISFDDAPWTDVLQPSVSVIAQPLYEMGWQAAASLLERIQLDGAREISTKVLPTEFIARESCCVAHFNA